METGQEKTKSKRTKRDILLRVGTEIAAVLFLAYTFWNPHFSTDETMQMLLKSVVSRIFGSLIFLLVLLYLQLRMFAHLSASCLSSFLPALAVAINNFPILSAAIGDAYLLRADLVWLYAIDALLIGIFEELAFRGVLFPILLENRRGTTKQIFWVTVASAAVFGLIHLVNLFEGAGIGPTLLQVGYSFLIGGMCSIVLLKSGNLFLCILLHTVYDFCGGLYPTLGAGVWWDTPTVIFTAALGVAVFIWMMYLLIHITPEEASRLYRKQSRQNDE